jgi:hypothetical protein
MMFVLGSFESWLGSVFFALLIGAVGFCAGYWVRSRKRI